MQWLEIVGLHRMLGRLAVESSVPVCELMADLFVRSMMMISMIYSVFYQCTYTGTIVHEI